jgi:endonuclease YncB( thermonuclease family)
VNLRRCTRAGALLARLVIAWVCAVAAGPAGVWAREPAPPLLGAITRVSDGDTLWLRPAGGGKPVKLRLQGIDAPELCQALGLEARSALRQRALYRQAEAEVLARDAYGRLLVVLRVDGQDVAAALVAQGLAWSEGYRGRGPYEAEERAAQDAGRGVHADPASERPRDFRRRHGPCQR